MELIDDIFPHYEWYVHILQIIIDVSAQRINMMLDK